jgi:hypothetical protein
VSQCSPNRTPQPPSADQHAHSPAGIPFPSGRCWFDPATPTLGINGALLCPRGERITAPNPPFPHLCDPSHHAIPSGWLTTTITTAVHSGQVLSPGRGEGEQDHREFLVRRPFFPLSFPCNRRRRLARLDSSSSRQLASRMHVSLAAVADGLRRVGAANCLPACLFALHDRLAGC